MLILIFFAKECKVVPQMNLAFLLPQLPLCLALPLKSNVETFIICFEISCNLTSPLRFLPTPPHTPVTSERKYMGSWGTLGSFVKNPLNARSENPPCLLPSLKSPWKECMYKQIVSYVTCRHTCASDKGNVGVCLAITLIMKLTV